MRQAHEQATLEQRTPREVLADTACIVEELTRDPQSGPEFHVSDGRLELMLEVCEFAELMDKNARRSAALFDLNRAARRVKK